MIAERVTSTASSIVKGRTAFIGYPSNAGLDSAYDDCIAVTVDRPPALLSNADPELPNGEKSRCFVVITREARDASGEVHDRMPAFLTPDTWDAWLTPEKLTGDRKTEMLAMLENTSSDVASTIREHIVDRKVSNSRTVDPTDPTLLEPVA
ncbi:SOS response-associated peptidase family protein [Microbacterium foliorum]|uniref:SOS response-associated peptidase family protein n=1 Tax=Microbacterium foliorum TaxID=104336 RepID=UPI0009C36181|nr:SOS response-associated peptidase family protein [Microbacterium foliorum]AQY02378.1 hypothetical protein B2G67_13560 [Microbacterium foliorum]